MSNRLTGFFESAARTLAIAVVLALLATAGLWYALQRGTDRTVTAFFTSTVGLYVNNTVNVQGIAVGTVDEIVPQGPVVRVELSVSNDVGIPAASKAVIVAPTLVSDRYVQLETYTGGPIMADGAVIPVQRTAVPVELDAVYKSLDTIATSLGPNGINKQGALNDLLRSSAGALGGNGEALKQTITEVAGAVGTLSDNRGDLFATVDNLGRFTNTLARNDGNVRALNLQLQDIAGFLSAERGNLSEVLRLLPPALEDVNRFVRDNRDLLRADIGQLGRITDALVRQSRALTEITDVAPLALGNLTNVYNASSGTLDVRPILFPNLGLQLDPRQLLCGLLSPTGPLGGITTALNALPVTDPLAATGANLTAVCGAVLNPEALQTAALPYLNLLDALGAAGTVTDIVGPIAGADVGRAVTTPLAGAVQTPGNVLPNLAGAGTQSGNGTTGTGSTGTGTGNTGDTDDDGLLGLNGIGG